MNKAMMSREIKIDSPHDVKISFWPASGASVCALESGWYERGRGHLTVGVCVGGLSLW